jgi:hypothetical protein
VEELFVVQGEVAFTVYVIVAVPVATAVTTPEELTVATAVFEDDHVPPVFPFEAKEVVPVSQIVEDPLIVPAFGEAITLTVMVSLSEPEQGNGEFTV